MSLLGISHTSFYLELMDDIRDIEIKKLIEKYTFE